MLIKTLLNQVHPLQGFVYGKTTMEDEKLIVEVTPRSGSRGKCGQCNKPGPTYDTARKARSFRFVPLWGITVFLLYAMRQIDCSSCGIKSEKLPWADGKNRTCKDASSKKIAAA